VTITARRVRWVIGLTIVTIAAVAVAFAVRFGTDPRAVDSPLLGHRVPTIELPRVDGPGELSLRDLEGEVLVVNFWASWCVPCRDEHAALQRSAARYGAQGVRVIGVVYQDDLDSVRDFLTENGGGYEVVRDPGSRAAIDFGLFGVPETFFVGPDGRIAAKVSGPVDDEVLTTTITRLLTGATP